METAKKRDDRYTLQRDGQRSLRFYGEKIADVSSHSHQGSTQNRWQELSLYRTAAGQLVVRDVHRTCWQGESDTSTVTITTDHELIDTLMSRSAFSGGELSALAKELLDAVQFDYAEEIP